MKTTVGVCYICNSITPPDHTAAGVPFCPCCKSGWIDVNDAKDLIRKFAAKTNHIMKRWH